MQKSETVGEIGKALAAAQGKIEGAKKDSENPFFKSKYADLAAVWDACRDELSRNQIAVVQTPRTEITENATVVYVGTLLLHASGEWISEELSAIPVKDDPQGIGSCITYLRRYALSAFTGVAPEDDDGNAASQGNGAPRQAPVNKSRAPKPVPEDAERRALMIAIKDAGGVLNSLGDNPPWTASRCNAFANENFNISTGVDGLTTPQLTELAKLMTDRIGQMKAPSGDIEEEARQSMMRKIRKAFKPPIIEQNMKQIFPGREFESLSHDELLHFETESVPF